ncbi:Hypothetical protein PENO1_068420 [Penicillium occitanis (nom. inval.)]|nr:Hypothetical protein PENO1_068420 [Penicillium occitanis (nom. inval.)]PCG96688.1 hypothetical protein PENOC_071520 [Penicillium occitanis (nom. inval.)]
MSDPPSWAFQDGAGDDWVEFPEGNTDGSSSQSIGGTVYRFGYCDSLDYCAYTGVPLLSFERRDLPENLRWEEEEDKKILRDSKEHRLPSRHPVCKAASPFRASLGHSVEKHTAQFGLVIGSRGFQM